MDWDSKMPPWDMEEGLMQNVEPNQSGMGSQNGGGRMTVDCSVDLKLGGLGEFGTPDKWKDQPRASPSSTAMAPSASPSKRARPPSGAAQNVSCLVDGCKADLSGCREYHRRHKVCEAHSKTPVVMVGGQEQRFCQQCSRFHMLVEFDEVKRSCRKRLDGHNRRRRKPQPESINSGSLFLSRQGVRFPTYPHILPTSVPEHNWTGIVKAEDEALYNHQASLHVINTEPHFPGSFPRYYKEGKQISFLQDGDAAFTRMAVESSSCQPGMKNISAAESSSSKIFADGLPQVLDSDCALSLLSSTTQASSINMGQMLPAERIPMAQPLVPSLQYRSLGLYSSSQNSSNVSATGFSCPGVGNEPVGTVLVSDADDLHCHDMFHVGDEGPSDGNSHAIPFSWQ